MAVYMEKGEDHRLTKSEVAVTKMTIMSNYQRDDRKKTGVEYEKSAFEAKFKSQPDLLKKAKFSRIASSVLRLGRTESK